MCRVQKHRKRHLGDEEATAKQMYIKASERVSKRALPEDEVIDSLAPALYWVRRGKPWLGLALLRFPGSSCIGGVRQGNGREGVVLVTVRCSCCWCAVSVSFSFIFCRNSEHAFLSRDPTTIFALKKTKHPFLSQSMEKFSPLTAPLRPPRPAPPFPKKIREPTVSGRDLLARWPDYYYYPFRKKYGVWIEPTPVKNWKHFILRPHSIYRQLTSNSAKVSFISCILVWVILKGCGFVIQK